MLKKAKNLEYKLINYETSPTKVAKYRSEITNGDGQSKRSSGVREDDFRNVKRGQVPNDVGLADTNEGSGLLVDGLNGQSKGDKGSQHSQGLTPEELQAFGETLKNNPSEADAIYQQLAESDKP